MDYDYSPRAWQKIVYAGAEGSSFAAGARHLRELAELHVSAERVRRASERIGGERVAERDARAAAYAALSLPAQRAAATDEPVPPMAAISMDGGRLQIFDRRDPQRDPDEGLWREMKVGWLATMTSQASAADPCPQLPESFVDPARISQLVREIKGFSAADPPAESAVTEPAEEAEGPAEQRPGRPQVRAKSVVATRRGVEEFGRLLAAEAWQRRLFLAPLKAFVADGAEANWGVWRRHFSDYVPITDFIHALTYVYAAALSGQAAEEGWQAYRQWAQWLWGGQVQQLIAALEARQQSLGEPVPEDAEQAPRRVVAKTLGYLRNQAERMRYDEYRRLGLPITSTHIESTVKQVNRRMKGTEKFWSEGTEAMLTLVADNLSDTPTLAHFWRDRPHRLNGSRCYHTSA